MKRFIFLILFFCFFCFGINEVKAAPVLADGTYKIQSALNSNKVIDVKGAKAAPLTNVQLYTFNDTDAQKWNVKYLNNGYYSITSMLDDKLSLDVSGASKFNKANVQIYFYNGNNAQQWLLKDAGDGYFYIVSRCNGLYVDVDSAKAVDGTNIQMYQGNRTNAQKFKFKEILTGEKAVEDGTYMISSGLSDSVAISLDDKTKNNVNINKMLSKYEQAWNIKYLNDGYYEISAYTDDDMFLSVDGDKTANGSNVLVDDNKNLKSTKWIIKKNSDGTYSIVSSLNNLYLDVHGASVADGTNVQIYQGNGTNAQKFKLTKIEFPVLDDSLYNISVFNNENIVLSVNNEVAYNKANIELATKSDKNAEKWYFKNIEDNIYEIKSAIDNTYVFDVSGASVSNKGNVQLYNSTGNNAQRWRIVKLEDGYYRFTNVNSGKNLDVHGGSFTSGTNIFQYENNNTNAQKFKLNKTKVTEYKQIIGNDNYILYSALNMNKSLRCGTTVFIYDLEGSSNEIITTEYIKNGFYVLKNGNKAFTNSSGKVVMSDYAALDSQLWYAVKNGEYYTFISKVDGKVLDIPSARVTNNNNLQTYTNTGHNAQKFYLEAVNTTILNTGYYNVSIGDKFLGLSSDLAYNGSFPLMQSIKNDSTQKWYIKNVGNNLYEIRYALNPNKTLDVKSANINDGTIVQMYESNSTDAQKWYVIALKNGSYKFVSKASHSCLTIDGDKTKIYSNNKMKDQIFSLTSVDEVLVGQTVENGYYTISTTLDTGKVLDINKASLKAGSNVQIYASNSSPAQIWYLKYIDNGLYYITSALSPKRALTNINGNVTSEKYTGSDNQKWYIRLLENNQVSIISGVDSLYVDVASGKTTNGTNVGMYTGNGTNAQKFILNSFSGTKKYRGIDVSYAQKLINWSKVLDDQIQFVLMRVGYGMYDNQKDQQFEKNYVDANSNDIAVGVYLYSYAMNVDEAKREAQTTLKWLNGRHLDLPVFYDMEDADGYKIKHGGIPNKETLTKMTEVFCDTIIQGGYKCGVYANKNWLINHLDAKKLATKYPIWLAHYTGPDDFDSIEWHQTNYNLTSYKFWQFSSLGQVSGITPHVDLDFGYDIFD